MLRLRFFVCQQCETVFADPERPPPCSCGTDVPMREITNDVQTEPYFTELRDADT
jgi:hypothetical protein